jgi:protein required for attachment to host cells
MTGLLIRSGEWVVVCDGAKALVLENVGDLKFPNLKTVQVFEHKNLPTHELGTDVPGRAISSVGNVRSAVDQTDWHQQEEFQFLTGVSHYLEHAIGASGKVKSLVVIAPPRALGMLRSVYSPTLKSAIRIELDKDLVNMPVHEIEKNITSG